MPDVTSVVFVGVGGQGTILVTSIFSLGLVAAGYDVKTSEIHGLSQRGGSVNAHVRFGRKVHSPIVGDGGADVLVAFEVVEALRGLPFLKPGGRLIVNNLEIAPSPVLTGRMKYPKGVIQLLSSKVDTTVVNAHDIAMGLGNVRVMNLVLLGTLVEAIGLGNIAWGAMIASTVKKDLVDINIAAFKAGRRTIAHHHQAA